MRKIAKIGRKEPKKATAKLVVVVVTLLAKDFFANLRLHLYLYFPGMSFLSSLYGKMKILSLSTIFFSSNFQEHVIHTCHISIERVLDHATYLAHLQFSRGHQPA